MLRPMAYRGLAPLFMTPSISVAPSSQWGRRGQSWSARPKGDVPFYGLPRPDSSPRLSGLVGGLVQHVTTLGNELARLAASQSLSQPPHTTQTTQNDTALHNEPHTQGTAPHHTLDHSWVDRLALTWHMATIAANDPTRADAVAAVGELTGRVAVQTHLLTQMQAHPVGRVLLSERPVVSQATIPYDALMKQARQWQRDPLDASQLTFGQAYGLFLLQHGFDPDERDEVRYIYDEELAYCMTRYRQCHDFWHVLTGLPPTVVGELGLKWLELFQTGLPSTALACTVGSLWATASSPTRETTTTWHGVSPSQIQDWHVIWNVYLPWARRISQRQQQLGLSGSSLLNVYYEKEWDTPLTELRDRLGIEEAPIIPLPQP